MFIGCSCPRKGYLICFVLIAVRKIPMALLSAADVACLSELPQLRLSPLPSLHPNPLP